MGREGEVELAGFERGGEYDQNSLQNSQIVYFK